MIYQNNNRIAKYNYLIVVFILFLQSCMLEKQTTGNFQLLKAKYTKDEIELFNDIAFTKGYVRRWEKDIRVQVIGKSCANCPDIDSVISIISPLIEPIKIKRVKNNGNIIVYRGVEDSRMKASHLGYASFKSFDSKKIQSAIIYESENADYLTLMHEFEHVLGLNHPRKLYPYYLLIWGADSPKELVNEYHIAEKIPEQVEHGHIYFKT